MDKDLLKAKSQNLPVYVYRLEAKIVLVHHGIGYELQTYSFGDIIVFVNQPLRTGDILQKNCCYYGNELVELIPQLQSKEILNGVEKNFRDYYGCEVTHLAISYVGEGSKQNTSGVGECRVFIDLVAWDALDRMKALENNYQELTSSEHQELRLLQEELSTVNNLKYWKQRISNWDDRFKCIGEPGFLTSPFKSTQSTLRGFRFFSV
jgi:hypothetical protein